MYLDGCFVSGKQNNTGTQEMELAECKVKKGSKFYYFRGAQQIRPSVVAAFA
jgi:hypothetical protein